MKLKALALASMVPLLMIAAPPANAMEAPEDPIASCLDEVDQRTSELPESTTGFDFVCFQGETLLEVASEASGGAEPAAREASPAREMAVMSDWDWAEYDCGWDQYPYTEVVNEKTLNFEFCLIYGQTNHPTNGSWSNMTSFAGQMYPGGYSHSISMSNWQDWTDLNVSVNYDLSLYKANFPAWREVSFVPLSYTSPWSGNTSASVAPTTLSPSQYGGTYQVRMHRFHIEVPTQGFLFDVTTDFRTPSYLCTTAADNPYDIDCRF